MTDASGFSSAAQKLRSLVEDSSILVLPGVADPWAARLAEQAGFEALFATGAGIANVSFGVPDIGLIGLAEMTEAVWRISRSIDIPLVVDGDTGYGNALNVYYAVEQYCRMGVAAITLEDQITPKRCGHFDGKDLIPAGEMVEKIVAFTEARGDSGTMLIARTDAIAVEGFDQAVARALSYVEAGADMIFLEAPSDARQLAAVPQLIPVPTVANMVEGGRTPLRSLADLEQMGYAAVLYANTAMRAAGAAMRAAFQALRSDGDTAAMTDQILTWEDRQAIAGLPRWLSREKAVLDRAARISGNGVSTDGQR
jgi:2-methylisocitrate lyase-like PEP mutase family enzyme